MDRLFKEKSQMIRIYLATETIADPIEKNIIETYLNPFPIKAIVTDLTFTKIQWVMPGIITNMAKEIIIEKKYESLLLKSRKIQIDSEYFEGWKQNGKLQYRIEENYIRCYIYAKQV